MKKEWKLTLISVTLIGFFLVLAVGSSDTDSDKQPSSNTSAPSSTSQETEYKVKLTTNASNIGNALTELGELAQNFQVSDEWVMNAALQVTLIRSYADEAIVMNVPPLYQSTHNLYIKGMEKYKESMDYFVEGVDNVDEKLIEKASVLMSEGAEYIKLATVEMEKVN